MKQYCCFRNGVFVGLIHPVGEDVWGKLPHDFKGAPVLYRAFSDTPVFWPTPDPGCVIFEMKVVAP